MSSARTRGAARTAAAAGGEEGATATAGAAQEGAPDPSVSVHDTWPAEVSDANQPQYAEIKDVLAVCGLTEARQYRAFRAHGVARLKDFEVLGDDGALSNLVNHYRKKDLADGGVNIGEIHVQNLRALIYWARDKRRRGKRLEASAFTERVMDMCIRKRRAEIKAKEDKPDPPDPGKLDPQKWHQWQHAFDNHLSAFDGADGVPLSYVIRKDKVIAEGHKWTDDREQLKYEAKLKGEVFRVDNGRVFTLLKQAIIGTNAWTWIEKFDKKQDGRKAMLSLRAHYDGPGEVEKRRAQAKHRLEVLRYKDEQSMSFETYITYLKEVFQALEECGRPMQEIEKVEHLLDKIQRNDGTIQALRVHILGKNELKNSFEAAANHLSQALTVLYPGAGRKADKRFVSSLDQNGSKKGRYKLKDGKVNGVDVSDPHRSFSAAEWEKLGPYKKTILKLRAAAQEDEEEASTNGEEEEEEEGGNDSGGEGGPDADKEASDSEEQPSKKKTKRR